jgi:hypothetical protein
MSASPVSNNPSAVRRQMSLLMAFAMTAIAGCSSNGSGSPSASNAGASVMSNGEGDGDTSPDAASASAIDAGGIFDASGTPDAKGTTTSGVDAGDSPAGQAGTNAYCAAVCNREAACLGVAVDASTCHCSAGTLTLYRSDYVIKLAACESAASCEDLFSDGSVADSGLDICAESALAQITPTAAVDALCSQLGLSTCSGDFVPDCPDTFKAYSDQSVNAVSACIADPHCTNHADCVTTALTP